MSAIAAVNSSASSAVASLLNDAASAATGSATPTATKSNQAASSASNNPVDIVDLSDRAKATLARAKAEQGAAGKLSAQVAAAKDSGRTSSASTIGRADKSTTESTSSLFAILAGRSAPPAQSNPDTQSDSLSDRIAAWAPTLKAPLTVRDGIAPFGDPTTSDAQFIKDMGLSSMLSGLGDIYDQQGFPPEIGQAMRTAGANGTIKIQDAADVADLNMHSINIYTPSAIGGPSAWGTVTQHPTGATKEALDQGRALAMWTADRGNVYLTW